MKRQSTQELAALLSETLADRPRKKARVLDLEGAEEEFDVAPSPREPAARHEPPARSEAPSPYEAPPLRTGQPLHAEAPPRHEPPAPRKGAKILPADAPHFRAPYEVIDRELAKIEPMARAVLFRLYRLAAGFYSDTCHVSVPKLASHCKMGETKVRSCLRALEADGYIRRVSMDLSNKNQEARGLTFEVYLARMPPSSRAAGSSRAAPSRGEPPSAREPNKESIKHNSKKGIVRLTPEETEAKASHIAARLRAGEGIEQIEPGVAPTMHFADWAAVKGMALASVKS